jgi:hypothetical protein
MILRKKQIIAAVPFLLIGLLSCVRRPASEHVRKPLNWTHFVRIGGHGLSLDRVDAIIQSATETGVFGIETDNDIPGRYESFLEPAEKLKAIRAVAEKAHAKGNFAFVYIAGLECITANADRTERTLFKEHPDWVQRNLKGEPALFGGGTAFWIDKGDEDVWISPYAAEWRKIYMERVRQIAGTGIDGVYVDIPYWMTHFDGWEDTWASFDDHTVAAFKRKTGLDAKKDLKLGDFSDPNFLQWVDFRIQTLTDFMKEIRDNVRAVNPACMTIPEIYPGIGEEAVRVGSDVYEMYADMDAIAHEYSAGGYTSAEREPLDWFTFMEGMLTFRAFAEGKATWMLTYSWDGEKKVSPADAMKNLAVSEVMAGANVWDARGHVMSGSNDMKTRKEIFGWIARNENTLYHPRLPISPVGVYFSPSTRNVFPDAHIDSYNGILHMLLQSHVEFQIVTPRTLKDFPGTALILPDVRCVSDAETRLFESLVQSGKKLIATGGTGAYDERRRKRSDNALARLGGSKSGRKAAGVITLSNCPGKAFLKLAKSGFNSAAWEGSALKKEIAAFMEDFIDGTLKQAGDPAAVEIHASPFVFTQTAEVDGKPHVFIANFGGLKGRERGVPFPEKNIRITFPAPEASSVVCIPFLGEPRTVPSEWRDGRRTCLIPEIQRGAVVRLEQP